MELEKAPANQTLVTFVIARYQSSARWQYLAELLPMWFDGARK
jgi:hypothetical protein